MKSNLVILCFNGQLAAWHFHATNSPRALKVQGQNRIKAGTEAAISDACHDLEERLKGDDLQVDAVIGIADAQSSRVLAGSLIKLDGAKKQWPWQILSWSWLANRFGLQEATPWELPDISQAQMLAWLVSGDDAEMNMVRENERLAAEREELMGANERLAAEREELMGANERLRAENAALQEQIDSFLAKPPRRPNGAATAVPADFGIEMIELPSGSFLMGSMEWESQAWDNEFPPRTVDIKAFEMGKTPVTLGQYMVFVKATKRKLDDRFIKHNNQSDQAPVVAVSWKDAQTFIAWLNEVTSGGWRLPSEAEWEYAGRAGERHVYCGSDDVNEVAWYSGNSGSKLHGVAQKKPNAFGLYDMSGNVWEWVQDHYHENYEGAPADGRAWESSFKTNRVFRGGSWNSSGSLCRAAYRNDDWPAAWYSNLGFRLARYI